MGMLSQFKKAGGGGFLNGVDALIKAVTFTTDPGFTNDGTQLWAGVTVRQDGSEEDLTVHVKAAGDSAQYVIGEDGSSLTPVDGAMLWENEPFSVLYASAVENGLEDVDSEEDGTLQFGHMAGAKVRFVQVKDDAQLAQLAKWATTKPAGKAAVRAKKYNEQGQKAGKDGKFYDPKLLKISAVYETGLDVTEAEEAPVKAKKATNGSGKIMPPSAATRSSATTAAKKAVAAAEESDLAEFAENTLVDILNGEKKKSITKTQLNLAVTRALKSDPRRETARVWLYDDTNLATLAELGVITYAKAGKEQVISLA